MARVHRFVLLVGLIATVATTYANTDALTTDFRKADSIAVLYPKYSLYDIKGLAEKLTSSLSSEEEKFRAIYKWVCNNIDNDYLLNEQNQRKREKITDPEELKKWNTKIGWQVIRNLIDKQKTVCTGYAYLLQELSRHAGLSCIVIDGYGRTVQANIGGTGRVNHSWNAVQLHNQWYLCDATWSAGAYDTQLHTYIRKYNDVYFLADPALFIRNHYPMDSAWILLKDKPTLNEFLNRPLIYSFFYDYQITKLIPETFNAGVSKGEKFFIRFETKADIVVTRVELTVNTPAGSRSFYPSLQKETNGLYFIEHTFTRKGTHLLNVRFDENYVFTYTVKVM